jgi:very-short-patch-repair endonuclease
MVWKECRASVYDTIRLMIAGQCVFRPATHRRNAMRMLNFPFEITDWDQVPEEVHKGETGTARWRTRTFGEVRVRMVDYSPGYRADHWCSKGHVVLCLEGELHTEGKDGRKQVLTPGMTYQVADDNLPHRSHTENGVKLFIVD